MICCTPGKVRKHLKYGIQLWPRSFPDVLRCEFVDATRRDRKCCVFYTRFVPVHQWSRRFVSCEDNAKNPFCQTRRTDRNRTEHFLDDQQQQRAFRPSRAFSLRFTPRRVLEWGILSSNSIAHFPASRTTRPIGARFPIVLYVRTYNLAH